MSGYGFKKKAGEGAALPDVRSMAAAPIIVSPEQERIAVEAGRDMGFTDRGQSRVERNTSRRRYEARTISVRGPVETLDWLADYTNRMGYSAYWQSIEDLRRFVEANERG